MATVRAMTEALAERRKRLQAGGGTPGPVFADAELAAARYHQAMVTPISRASADTVVLPRGVRPAPAAPAPAVTWSWDSKWLLRSFLPPAEEQVLAMLYALMCPVLMVSGELGYETARYVQLGAASDGAERMLILCGVRAWHDGPLCSYGGERKRAELAKRKAAIPTLREVVLPAQGHYPHLDAADAVAKLVAAHLAAPPHSRL